MEEMIVSKRVRWEMAHVLTEHSGQCANLHGHSYEMEVFVKPDMNDPTVDTEIDGMVIDFQALKTVIKREVLDKVDHAYAFNTNAPADSIEMQIGLLLEEKGNKVWTVGFPTTAENMAWAFYHALKTPLSNLGVILVRVEVKETASSRVSYGG